MKMHGGGRVHSSEMAHAGQDVRMREASKKISARHDGCGATARCWFGPPALHHTVTQCPVCPCRWLDLQAMQKLQNTKRLQDLAGGAGLDTLLKK